MRVNRVKLVELQVVINQLMNILVLKNILNLLFLKKNYLEKT